jgi:hypothetical protein
MLAALRTAVASVSSELAEKNAVTRILAEHGHRRAPTVVQQRDGSGITRVYLWTDAGIALVTGPSLEGTVYEVHAVPADADPTSFDLFIPGERGRSAFAAGRKAKALANPAPSRTSLAATPRRIAARPVAPPPARTAPMLHNPPKGPPASIPGPEAFAPAAGDVYGSAMLDKMLALNKYGTQPSVPTALLATVIRRIVKDIGLADKVSIEKDTGSVWDVTFHPKPAGTMFEPDVEPKLKKVMTVGLGGNYGGIGFAGPSSPDPYADYAGPTATVFKAPYANYVEALLYGALVANGIATLPSYAPPTPSKAKASTASSTAKAGAGKVYITFQPGVGLTVSGDTYDVKDIIKAEGFFWTGKPDKNGLGKFGYPPSVWAGAKSDSATSTSSLVGWAGKQQTVADTAVALSQALTAAGMDVLVTGIIGAGTPIAAPAAPAAPKSADPNPPPPSPVTSISVPFGAPLEPLQPNPVWGEGGGVNAIASRLVYHAPKPGGGLSGEVLRDTQTGKLFLAKYPPNKDMIASEVLAAHLYRAFGALAPDMRAATVKGKAAILSPWIDGLKQIASSASGWNATVPALEKKYLAATFPLDVWLADYDVVGLTYDNMLWVPPDPHVIRVDPGASLMFRASGSLKSPLPTTDAAPDLDSMLFKPKNDKTPVVFAAAKDDPSLMLPVANALTGTPIKFIDALAKWAGYAMSTGLTFPTLSIGDFLYDRAKTLRDAVMAKAGVSASTVSVGTPAGATVTFDREKLAKAVAELIGGTYALAGGVLPTVYVSTADGAQWHTGFYHASQGFAQAKVMKYDGVTNEDFGVVSIAVPSPFTSAFYFKAVPYFADEIKSIINANTASAPAPTPATPAGEPTTKQFAGVAGNIAKRVAALLPGLVTVKPPVGPSGVWEVNSLTSTATGVSINVQGDTLHATIFSNGAPKQKLSYEGVSDASISFLVSRAADIANAFKPYLMKAPAPAVVPTLPTSSAPLALESLSLTEVDALPNGSVVASEDGTSLYIRDSSGLWRELTPEGDFTSGIFSDDVVDTLGTTLLAYEGDGKGPEPDDAIMLSAYYSTAKKKIAAAQGIPAAAAPKPPRAPKPAAPAKSAAAMLDDDPEPWPSAHYQIPGAMPNDSVWYAVGGAKALAMRLANAVKGKQLGSFPGGKMTDPATKKEFYVKFFKNVQHAETEALASHFYRALGINAPDARVVTAGLLGGHASGYNAVLITPWKDDYKQRANGDFTTGEKVELAKQFPADVWMANYDVVGKGPATKYDNLLVNAAYNVEAPAHFLRVDQGAALDYRSTGSVKKSASDWAANAAKTWGDFLSSQHPTIFKVFGNATPTTGAETIQRINLLTDSDFFGYALFRSGRTDLTDVLKARAGWLFQMLTAFQTLTGKKPKAAAPAPAPAAPAPTGIPNYAISGTILDADELNEVAFNPQPLLVASTTKKTAHLKKSGGLWLNWKGTDTSYPAKTEKLAPGTYKVIEYDYDLEGKSYAELYALAFPQEPPTSIPLTTGQTLTITLGTLAGATTLNAAILTYPLLVADGPQKLVYIKHPKTDHWIGWGKGMETPLFPKQLPGGLYTMVDYGPHLAGDKSFADLYALAFPPSAAPTFVEGTVYTALTLNANVAHGQWILVRDTADPSVLYTGGFKDGFCKVGPTGLTGSAGTLPEGNYEVVSADKETVGATASDALYAQYAVLKGPKTVEQIKALAQQVQQIVAAKGFATQGSVGMGFIVTLYEGTEPNGFEVLFMRSGASGKVTIKFQGSDLGLYTLGKAGVAETVANAVLGQLRLKIAQFNLTKQPASVIDLGLPMSAAAAAATAMPAVGAILTTVAQVKALPQYSVIAYAHAVSDSKAHIIFYRCVASDEWMTLTFDNEPKGAPLLTSEVIDDGDSEWGVVVIRVGSGTDLDPFFGHFMDVTGKSGNTFVASFPIGA